MVSFFEVHNPTWLQSLEGLYRQILEMHKYLYNPMEVIGGFAS